jgi:hypothetical protein
MDIFKALVSGVVIIGLVTAVGLHGTGLAKVIKPAGQATSSVLGTAETGKP